MKKRGLLLGSFDPIHIAHINIASCALNSGLCDEIFFVVAKHNPWKSHEPAPFDLRCKMIEASIIPFNGKCSVCDLEKDIEPPTYSYKVIDKICEKYPEDELYIIAGTDTIQRISHWKNFDTNINGKVKFIEVTRGDKELSIDESSGNPFAIKYCTYDKLGEVPVIITHRMDISSTMVRNLVKDDMNPIPYVTNETYKIIIKNKLYKNGNNN